MVIVWHDKVSLCPRGLVELVLEENLRLCLCIGSVIASSSSSFVFPREWHVPNQMGHFSEACTPSDGSSFATFCKLRQDICLTNFRGATTFLTLYACLWCSEPCQSVRQSPAAPAPLFSPYGRCVVTAWWPQITTTTEKQANCFAGMDSGRDSTWGGA